MSFFSISIKLFTQGLVFGLKRKIKRGNSLRHCPRQPRQAGKEVSCSRHLHHPEFDFTSFQQIIDMGSPSPTGPNMSHAETLATMDGGWMLRGCQAYYDEMKACTSYRGRLVGSFVG